MRKISIIDSYSDTELLSRLQSADSYKAFLEDLGYSNGRAQHTRNLAEKRFSSMGINYRDYLKPKYTHGAKASRIPNNKYYVKGTYRGSALSKRARRDGIIPYECAICLNKGEWQGAPITLHLDHIDGDNTNNIPSNIRFLCPNCHAQTDTYGNKTRHAGVSQLAEESDLESVQ